MASEIFQTIRITKEMREDLEKVAEIEHRSLSSQIVHYIARGLMDDLIHMPKPK